MKFTPRRPQTNVNVSQTHPLKDFGLLAGGLLGAVVVIYLVLGLILDVVIPRLSPEFEQQLAAAIGPRFTDCDDSSNVQRYLQELVDQLQAQHPDAIPYRVKVSVVSAKEINAAALPGGQMIVFSGLLEKMESESEIAFVLAHELGHYANRDHLRGIGRGLVFVCLSTVLLGPDNSISNMIGHGVMLTELSFSRKQESAADAFALDAVARLYQDAAGATDFFTKIKNSSDTRLFGPYFSSHPDNQRRIDQLNALIAQHRYPVGTPRPLRMCLVAAESPCPENPVAEPPKSR